jgi:hypothetical protein
MRSDITSVMRRHCRQLNASVGASGPHGFAVRKQRASSSHATASIASRPNTRDDREAPLQRAGMAQHIELILATDEAKYFCET